MSKRPDTPFLKIIHPEQPTRTHSQMESQKDPTALREGSLDSLFVDNGVDEELDKIR